MPTFKELRELASLHNIRRRSFMNKQQLIDALIHLGIQTGGASECIQAALEEIKAGRLIITGAGNVLTKSDYNLYMKTYHPDKTYHLDKTLSPKNFVNLTGKTCYDIIVGKTHEQIAAALNGSFHEPASAKSRCDSQELCPVEYQDATGTWHCAPERSVKVSRIVSGLNNMVLDNFREQTDNRTLPGTLPNEYFTITLRSMHGQVNVMTVHPTESVGATFAKCIYRNMKYVVGEYDAVHTYRFMVVLGKYSFGNGGSRINNKFENRTWIDLFNDQQLRKIDDLNKAEKEINDQHDKLMIPVNKAIENLLLQQREKARPLAIASMKRQIEALQTSSPFVLLAGKLLDIKKAVNKVLAENLVEICDGAKIMYDWESTSVLHDKDDLETYPHYRDNSWADCIMKYYIK